MCLDRHWMSDFSIFSWHLLTKLKNISCFFTYHCFFDKYSFLLFWIISKIVLVFWGPFFLSILKKAMQSGQNGHHLLELFRRVLKQVFDNEVSTSYILFLNSWDIWGLPKPFLRKKIGLVFQIGHVILNYKHFYHVTCILTTVFFL
jgi:hypothetical protein